MELKDRIKEVCVHSGMKKAAFARALGMSTGIVTQWLDGTIKSLKYETAKKMQALTGYSALWIAEEEGEKMAAEKSEPTPQFDGLTPGAIELAALYDMIPVSNRIKRVQAYNAASAAILAVLQPDPASAEPAPGQKTQPV